MLDRADREFGGILVSLADWPIVLTEFPEKRVADEALHAVLDHLEALLNEAARIRQKLFFITDLTLMREITPASQRQYTGDWTRKVSGLSKAASVGSSTVTPSPILRGIITAVFWIQPPPTPTSSVSTRHEAMLNGIAMLKAADALLPPRLLTYRDVKRSAGPSASGGR